jgi:hypothetical protein
MQQKRNVVAAHIQVALVDIGDVGQGVEILNLRPVGGVRDRTILAVRDS